MASPVFVAPTSPVGLPEDVAVAVDWALGQGLDPARPTFVKVNGNFNLAYPGSNTSRWFIDALLQALRTRGFVDLQVIEGDLPEFRAADMVRSTGLDAILERHRVPFLALETLARDARELPAVLSTSGAQLVNVPVPHTHAQAVISCATKNLFGLLPWDRRKYHGVLEDKLLEIAAALPSFAFVDGTVGLDGESTRRGNPIRCDLVFAGSDPLAVDWVVAQTMGFSPTEIPVLRLAAERDLVPEATVVGPFAEAPLPRHRFALELSLLRRMTNALYKTPLVRFAPLWMAGDLVRTRWHRLNAWRKKRELESGPWMDYERSLSDRLANS